MADTRNFEGILTVKQITKVPEKLWDMTAISDIMTPASQISTTQPRQAADTLFEEMSMINMDYIPVMEECQLLGVVTRDALMNAVKIRAVFRV